MIRKVASVMAALAILAIAFLLIPAPDAPGPSPTATPADAPEGTTPAAEGATPDGIPEGAAPAGPDGDPNVQAEEGGPDPAPPEGEEYVDNTGGPCIEVHDRLVALVSDTFAEEAGNTLRGELQAEDVVAYCGTIVGLPDDELVAAVVERTGIQP